MELQNGSRIIKGHQVKMTQNTEYIDRRKSGDKNSKNSTVKYKFCGGVLCSVLGFVF